MVTVLESKGGVRILQPVVQIDDVAGIGDPSSSSTHFARCERVGGYSYSSVMAVAFPSS